MGSGHHHHSGDARDGRLVWAVAVNVALTVAQVAGGVLSGSLALIADALHNLSDAASIVLALLARRIARKPADRKRTFGYRRAELVGALINLTALMLIGIYLVYEAAWRLLDPRPVHGWIVIGVAGLALLVDVVTAILTYALGKESLNVKAAFVHNLSDALASVGVIVSGTLILWFEWYWIDPVVTVLISAYILWQGASMMRATIRILMDSVPEDIDLDQLVAAIEELPRVENVHHLHVWQLGERHRALEAHVVLESGAVDFTEVKARIKELLVRRFDIAHSTLEFELEGETCHGRHVIARC